MTKDDRKPSTDTKDTSRGSRGKRVITGERLARLEQRMDNAEEDLRAIRKDVDIMSTSITEMKTIMGRLDERAETNTDKLKTIHSVSIGILVQVLLMFIGALFYIGRGVVP